MMLELNKSTYLRADGDVDPAKYERMAAAIGSVYDLILG